MNKFLIAGLGNPGAEYDGTRHNIGFEVLDAFVKKHQAVMHSERLAEQTEIRWKGKIFVCIKPTTYMNLSGKAIKYWMQKEGIAIESILIIVDELAIPLEKLRLRPTGSDGGHNGLKSIQESLQTDQYARLRFGIGNNYQKGKQVEWVLGKWHEHERDIVQTKIAACVQIIESFALEGLSAAMNKCNNLTFGG
ncbi:MAG: aminoacyl-tRNA hydrolase [Williamsia sp.]|nr:aminoacyl-tRNA hydrolase [Williamsia sp.]